MQCPYCQTENRDDLDRCYHCDKDLSMLRLIINKAKHHYNRGLELAERGHDDDAIQELRNALELDQTLINAHVVLGSLYARHEQFEQAKQCWTDAIKKDNRYNKAHEYLSKAESVQHVFPTIKRLQILALVCGLLFVICFGVMVYALIPEPQPPSIDEVLAELPVSDFRKASVRRELARIALNEQMPDKIQQLAGNLNRMIDNNINNWLEMSERALDGESPEVALLMLERAAWSEGDDPEIKVKMTQMRERAIAQMAEKVHTASLMYQSGRMDYEDFEQASKHFLDRFAETPEGQDVEELRMRIRDMHIEKTMVTAQTLIMTDPLPDALRRANVLSAQFPSMSDSLRAMIDQRLATEAEVMFARIEAQIRNGQYAEAQAAMGELKLMYESAVRNPPAERLAALNNQIAELQSGLSLEAANEAYDKGDYAKFLKLTENVERITSDPVTQSKLNELRIELLRKQAAKEAQWFADLDWRFPEMLVSAEDAAHAIEVFRGVIPNLPDEQKYMHTAILFYTACAYLRLDQAKLARELIIEIESLKDVSYPRYVRNYVENLKKNHPAVDPAIPLTDDASGMGAPEDDATSQPVELEIMKKDDPGTDTQQTSGE